MKEFIHRDFLLNGETARQLYHNHAEQLPIIDYHCHLAPEQIALDYRYRSITELWLGGDHYKWRIMRANGVDERYITGDASDWEKFRKWAETVPYTMGNPLYHWTHMELRTAFGITETLNSRTARGIYERCNEMLRSDSMSARGMMRRYRVEVVCTTDDPADNLSWHRQIEQSGFETRVLPAWRADKAVAVGSDGYLEYVALLSEAADTDIRSLDTLLQALRKRHDYFASCGCRLADNGLGDFPFAECIGNEAASIYYDVLAGKSLSRDKETKLRTYLLLELARMNHEKGWAQQYHFGALRNVNSRMYKALGADSGFDTMGNSCSAVNMARFLDTLESENRLAKTVLYNLNPADNAMVAAMAANFQDGSVPGKMQYGTAWWFNDSLDGMVDQLNTLALQGLLSRFVGMLTDSRSFLSYPRHDYFRRILCNLIGGNVDRGLMPVGEMERISGMVEDICYNNAKQYFGF